MPKNEAIAINTFETSTIEKTNKYMREPNDEIKFPYKLSRLETKAILIKQIIGEMEI